MQRKTPAISGLREQRFRHDRETAAHAGESARLGKAAELNGALARAFDFVDGMRNIRLRNIAFVGGIEEENGLVRARVSHPGL